MGIIKKLFGRRENVAADKVAFDSIGVTRTMPNGDTESVNWDKLRAVVIETTDRGPFVDDVFWILFGEESGCIVPSESIGMDALLERLQELPGFKNDQVIEAMGSTSNSKFVVWEQEGWIKPE